MSATIKTNDLGEIELEWGKVKELVITNSLKPELVILRIDAVTTMPLQDAEFMVTTSDGAVVGTSNGIFVSDSTGLIEIPNLTRGSYTSER